MVDTTHYLVVLFCKLFVGDFEIRQVKEMTNFFLI